MDDRGGLSLGPWLRFLMLSGQRLGEVAGLRWDELHGDVWAIPAARHKSGRRHEVPLSGTLQDILGALPRHDAHAFSHRVGKPVAPTRPSRNRIGGATGLTGWRFHDVRRTAATFMADGSVSRFTIERVLGHTEASVTAVYDRHLSKREARRARGSGGNGAMRRGVSEHERLTPEERLARASEIREAINRILPPATEPEHEQHDASNIEWAAAAQIPNHWHPEKELRKLSAIEDAASKLTAAYKSLHPQLRRMWRPGLRRAASGPMAARRDQS